MVPNQSLDDTNYFAFNLRGIKCSLFEEDCFPKFLLILHSDDLYWNCLINTRINEMLLPQA